MLRCTCPRAKSAAALEPTAPGTPQERATALTKVLEKVPQRIEQGRKNLVKPPRSYTESAIFKTEGTIKLLRAGAPALAKDAGDAGKALTAAAATAPRRAGRLSQVPARRSVAALDRHVGVRQGELRLRAEAPLVDGRRCRRDPRARPAGVRGNRSARAGSRATHSAGREALDRGLREDQGRSSARPTASSRRTRRRSTPRRRS